MKKTPFFVNLPFTLEEVEIDEKMLKIVKFSSESHLLLENTNN